MILQSSIDQQVSSAFVIFRALLDDLLRYCYVHASSDRQGAINDLTARECHLLGLRAGTPKDSHSFPIALTSRYALHTTFRRHLP